MLTFEAAKQSLQMGKGTDTLLPGNNMLSCYVLTWKQLPSNNCLKNIYYTGKKATLVKSNEKQKATACNHKKKFANGTSK